MPSLDVMTSISRNERFFLNFASKKRVNERKCSLGKYDRSFACELMCHLANVGPLIPVQ